MDPLFAADRDALKASLQLSTVCGADAEAMLDKAILAFRVWLERLVGRTKIEGWVALTPGNPPATDDEYTRAAAEMLECLWIQKHLLQYTAAVSLSAAGSLGDFYQDSQPYRTLGFATREAMVQGLERDISDLMTELCADVETDGGFFCMTIEPSSYARNLGATPPLVETMLTRYNRWFLWPW